MCEIEQVLAREKVQSQLVATKRELRVLALECSQAFEAVGMDKSSHPQVQKAINLCSSHISTPSHKSAPKDMASSAIGTLWKRGEGDEEEITDRKELATSILGTSLVNTLVEENREPPDVSHIYLVQFLLATCKCIHTLGLQYRVKV